MKKQTLFTVAILLSRSNGEQITTMEQNQAAQVVPFGLLGEGDDQGPIRLYNYDTKNAGNSIFDIDEDYNDNNQYGYNYGGGGIDYGDYGSDGGIGNNQADQNINSGYDPYRPQPSKNLNQPTNRRQNTANANQKSRPSQNDAKKNSFGWGNKKQNDKSVAQANYDDFKMKSMDYFEKLMYRLSKVENHTEALIIGCGLMVFGIIFIFAGAQSLQVIFGIIASMVLTALISAFLCILFDVPWDSEMGVGLSGISFLLSAPFVQYALKFSEHFAVPVVTGLSLAAIAEISLNLAKVTDVPPYHYKTVTEAVCFGAGFLVALKLKDYLAMLVTSFFGGFICTMAASIIINEMPMKDVKHRNGKISLTRTQLFQLYMPYIISILILTIIGFMYQREQLKDSQRINAQQQQLSKMMNSKPKMSLAQIERGKAKMAAASRANSSEGATRSYQNKEKLLNSSGGAQNNTNEQIKRINESQGMTSTDEQFSGDNSRRLLEQKIRSGSGAPQMNDEEKQSFLSKF